MIKGFDASTLSLNEEHGAKYYLDNLEEDCLVILKKCGINLIRLRLFNDPYDANGNSYGAGNCDLDGVKKIAKRCKELNLDWYLDFHYSDCWADPGKQTMPKAWINLDIVELERELYKYTKDVLNSLKKEGILPKIVSIGNEITNGLLWPIGKIDNFKNMVRLVSSGIKACNEVDKNIKTMIHLDNGGNNELYRHWFDGYFKSSGRDFDYIGLSYYPLWHGQIEGLKSNLNDLAVHYKKEMIVTETSYPFTLEDYAKEEGLDIDKRVGMASKRDLLKDMKYEISPNGQLLFLEELSSICNNVTANKCLGFVYWGGECIPIKGVGWSSLEGRLYMKEDRKPGNEWANQALFDYSGNALIALKEIKKL